LGVSRNDQSPSATLVLPKAKQKQSKRHKKKPNPVMGGDDPEVVIPDPPTSVAADKEGDPSTLTLGESQDDQPKSSTLLAKVKNSNRSVTRRRQIR